MDRLLTRAVSMVLLEATFGCAANRPPPIHMVPGAEQIKVVRSGDQVPSPCHDLGLLSESDGQTDGPRHYTGTDARVVMKLRNSAVGIGANALALLDFDV